VGLAVERHEQGVDGERVVRDARIGHVTVIVARADEAMGGDEAKRDQRHEQESKRQRHHPYGLDRRERDRERERDRAKEDNEALPQRRTRPRAQGWMARGQAFDGMKREGWSKVAADRLSHRNGRCEREVIGRKPRQHGAKRVRPKTVGRKYEAAGAVAFLEHASAQALARTCHRRGRHFGGGKLGLEWRAAPFGQGAIIVFRREPTIGDHHLVGMHAPVHSNRLSARQGGFIDEAAEEKTVFGLQGRALARDNARKLPFDPARLRHKRHGNAPSIHP
jgi:hypothetical protein